MLVELRNPFNVNPITGTIHVLRATSPTSTPCRDCESRTGWIESLCLLKHEIPFILIMDESSGRAMARNLNIRITGTLGVLLKATAKSRR